MEIKNPTKINAIELSIDECKNLLCTGDILLFRGHKFYSRLIAKASEGLYSHVALVGKVEEDFIETIEFHERRGGAIVNLEIYNKIDYRTIDVYRPMPKITLLELCQEEKKIKKRDIEFNGNQIVRDIEKLTGLPYGWRRIWWILKYKIGFFRLFADISNTLNDENKQPIYPICSSIIAYAFSKNNFDLIKNKGDEWTEPNHIANSSLLCYLFSLRKPI